jgi:hypothetical protein
MAKKPLWKKANPKKKADKKSRRLSPNRKAGRAVGEGVSANTGD